MENYIEILIVILLLILMIERFYTNRSRNKYKNEPPKETLKQEVQKNILQPKKKTDFSSSYQVMFLERNQWTARRGKTIYVRRTHHERLSMIAKVVGKNKLSISDYIDKILDHHFIEYEAEIKELFKDNYKPIL